MAQMQLERLGKFKMSLTSSGIEPATFQLAVKYLNQLLY
jgi:hypothetical protein